MIKLKAEPLERVLPCDFRITVLGTLWRRQSLPWHHQFGWCVQFGDQATLAGMRLAQTVDAETELADDTGAFGKVIWRSLR